MSIVVIGSSNVDLVVRTPHIPRCGETVLGGDLVTVSGGKGANQAVAAAKLGAQVWFVGRLGQDGFGDFAFKSIQSAGVHTDYIIRDSATPNGVALICVDDEGQNAIVVSPGANGSLNATDLDPIHDLIADAKVIVTQLETSLEVVEAAAMSAKQSGSIMILNPAPAAPLSDSLLSMIDIITPNETEVMMLTGCMNVREAAYQLLERGVGSVVVTMGAAGAIIADHNGDRNIGGVSVRAVDSTAAGDCFTGALAVALDEGRSLDEAVYFANRAAAISVTRRGAQTAMPTRTELESLSDF